MRVVVALTIVAATGCSMFGYPVDRTDPRFHGCAGDAARVTAAFPMLAARDYGRHIPLMGRSPELDESDEPAFVVVFESSWPGGISIAPPAEKHLEDRQPPPPGLHDVCIWVGAPGRGSFTVYGAVNTTGLAP